MSNVTNLEELGLSKNQSLVYETLIKHGECTSTKISSLSGVPYGRIYDVLGKLIEKGFVRIVPGRTKIFIATSPQDLIKIIEQKETSLQKVKENINSLQKFYESQQKEIIEIATGDKGFWKIIQEMEEAKFSEYSIRWNFKERAGNLDVVKNKIKRKIDIKDLINPNQENRETVFKLKKANTQTRILKNDGVAMSIQDEEEVLVGLIKSNTTLLIRDKPFAKIMKKMFEETYKNAEEI
jgi:sugar-specific transcriptional regulator TrmB